MEAAGGGGGGGGGGGIQQEKQKPHMAMWGNTVKKARVKSQDVGSLFLIQPCRSQKHDQQ